MLVISEKAMATHSTTLAWKIPWTEEPGRLQSMGSLRVRHDWATSLSLFIFMHWRRKWQPVPVFLPRESQGCGSLVGCHLWGSHRVGYDWRDLAAAACHLLKCEIILSLLSILGNTWRITKPSKIIKCVFNLSLTEGLKTEGLLKLFSLL